MKTPKFFDNNYFNLKVMINTDLHIFFMFYTQSTKIVTSN